MFVNFVSEKGCESQDRRNEDCNPYIFEEATRIIYSKYFTCFKDTLCTVYSLYNAIIQPRAILLHPC